MPLRRQRSASRRWHPATNTGGDRYRETTTDVNHHQREHPDGSFLQREVLKRGRLQLRVTASPMESLFLLAPAARRRPPPRGRRLWAGVPLRQDVFQYAFAVVTSGFGKTIHQFPRQRVEEEDREVRARWVCAAAPSSQLDSSASSSAQPASGAAGEAASRAHRHARMFSCRVVGMLNTVFRGHPWSETVETADSNAPRSHGGRCCSSPYAGPALAPAPELDEWPMPNPGSSHPNFGRSSESLPWLVASTGLTRRGSPPDQEPGPCESRRLANAHQRRSQTGISGCRDLGRAASERFCAGQATRSPTM